MRKLIIALATLATLGLSAVGNANPGENPMYIGPMVSYYWLDDDRLFTTENHDTAAVGLAFGWNLDEANAWEFSAQTGGELLALQMNYIRRFPGQDTGWSPYLLGGVSFFEDDDAPGAEEDSMQLQVGAGVSKFFDSETEVRFDVRPHYIVGGNPNSNGWDFSVNAGVFWHFGAQPAPVVEPAPVVQTPPPAPEPQMRTITIRLNVLFDFDQDVVKAIYGDELEQVADAMKAHDDIELVLEGHTDARSSDQYNNDLSQRRVEAVKAKLVQDYQIPANRIATRAFGESQPVAGNDTDAGRAQNRRVVGVISWTEEVQ